MAKNIAVIYSEFNSDITSKMLMRAKTLCRNYGFNIAFEALVPGVYDMPVFIKKALQTEGIEGVVLLGAVVKGETAHDRIVVENTARKAADLSVEFGKPVTLGIIGPDASGEKANARADEYASRAVKALHEILKEMERLA